MWAVHVTNEPVVLDRSVHLRREAATPMPKGGEVRFPRVTLETEDAADQEYRRRLVDGVRALPVKLLRLDSEAPIGVGPYEAAVLRLAVSGPVADLDKLLKWLETDDRLFRIDAFELTPPHGNAGRGVSANPNRSL